MTVEDRAESHGVSFHDAKLVGLQVDYRERRAVLGVNLDVSNPEHYDGPIYRPGQLSFSGVQFVVVEPQRYQEKSESLPWIVDIGSPQASVIPENLPAMIDGCFLSYAFINDWNSFIWISAADVRFEWLLESS